MKIVILLTSILVLISCPVMITLLMKEKNSSFKPYIILFVITFFVALFMIIKMLLI